MNSFINKVKNWFKHSTLSVFLTIVALVFVVCVGVVVNSNNNDLPVANNSESIDKVENSNSSFDSSSSDNFTTYETIQVPFTIDAKISRYFFDSSDPLDIKSQSLINYDNKFVPSLGVSYTNDNKAFNVVCSFDGVVVEKINDSLYGLTVVVESVEGLKAYYSGLSEVSVYVNEKVTQGQKIGESGESVINASLGNHLHFSIMHGNEYLNPLKAYNKTIEEIIK